MTKSKISTKKVSELVEEQIQGMIQSGTFKSGEKLPSVRELCEMFEVGRSAVRDAMTTLKGKGILQVKQGEGAYVCSFDSKSLFASQLMLPDTKDIRELFQVRKMLEPGLVEMAAEKRSEEDVLILESLLTQESGRKWEADYEFHMRIARISGNQIIVQLMEFISAATRKAMIDVHQHIQSQEGISSQIEKQHHRIFQSIQSREPHTARESLILHLDYVEKVLVNNVLIHT
ncbi:FadR/GntR family transcriptional regulator [Bacillus sp. Marseille-Q1617]|uniref:FadR/GntR family transcriptional regulator n=1 Tax=Bacillus sp. Marseille-Q1617 TaxID=2736887 RepID=UPI00158ED90A|nr:FadR/GntR family transcriptional regulator [Bacillus sp. Marseille-Q1617]